MPNCNKMSYLSPSLKLGPLYDRFWTEHTTRSVPGCRVENPDEHCDADNVIELFHFSEPTLKRTVILISETNINMRNFP